MNLLDVQLALRAQLLALQVATTGSTNLSRTAAGYARAAGSFVTDGFTVGMELVPAGFPTNEPQVVDQVAAQLLTMRGGCTAAAVAGSRSLTVGLPPLAGLDNQSVTPAKDRWWWEEEFIAQPGRQISFPAAAGTKRANGLYLARLYGANRYGTAALSTVADAIIAQFQPDATITAASGEAIRIGRGDGSGLLPWRDPLRQSKDGYAVIPITVPWWVAHSNP